MSDISSNEPNQPSRRKFIKNGTMAGAALGISSMAMPSALGQTAESKTKKLKVGVVGLGGRGSGAIADVLRADPNTVLWAAGEITEKKLRNINRAKKSFKGRVDTDGGKREFIGFDAYKKVIDSGVDIVMLTTTPAFRPLHLAYAVAAEKHIFMEKPFALDIPGLKSVIESAKKSKANNKSILTGLVWRYSPHLITLKEKLNSGVIGDILTVSSAYCGGRPNVMPDPKFKPPTMSSMEWAQRYWQNYLELSGDGILEYMIHGIDRMTWFMGDAKPARCYANGGNISPVKGANNWDSFGLHFEYPDGRISNFIGTQIRGTYTPSGDTIVGTKGTALVKGRSAQIIVGGKTLWEGSGALGYQNEHKILIKHIREGKVYNDVIDQMANSHIAGIMGRTAAYTGKLITDKQLMGSKDVLLPGVEKLDYTTPFEPRDAATPGKTPFV